MLPTTDGGLAGAGGVWPIAAEAQDTRAVAQAQSLYCGCACAVMILHLLGIPRIPSQHEVSDLGGGVPFSVNTLSAALNAIWELECRPGEWIGGSIPDPKDTLQLLSDLGANAPWVAMLKDPRERLGHFVTVASVSSHEIEILDPQPPGTAYQMSVANFLEYWTYSLVYLRLDS